MHIAHFIHRYPPAIGGAEAYFARLTRELTHLGHQVTVWTTTAQDLQAFWRRGPAEVDSQSPLIRRYAPARWPGRKLTLKLASLLPSAPWQCRTLPASPILPAMLRDVQRYDGPLDLVHATAFPYTFPLYCAWRLAQRRNVPFFLTPFLHLGDLAQPANRVRRQYTSRPLRWLLRRADAIFVQTPSERHALLDLGVPEKQIILQGLGVDEAECTGGDREQARKIWRVQPHDCVIGHLANASREKGTVDLLRAAERLYRQGLPMRIVLAGPSMPNFLRFWRRYPLPHIVTRLGEVTDQERRNFFAGIDIFALPSQTDAFGLVLLEAWANGKPNVVYHAGGPGDLVRHDTDGLIAPCGDWHRLAEQLQRLIQDPSLRQTLGNNGRERIRSLTWDRSLGVVRQQIEALDVPRG